MFFITFALYFLCHFSSAVEQLTRNEQVVGSNPMSGSKSIGKSKPYKNNVRLFCFEDTNENTG